MKLLGLTGQKIVTKYYANISEILYSQVFSNSPLFSTNRLTNGSFATSRIWQRIRVGLTCIHSQP